MRRPQHVVWTLDMETAGLRTVGDSSRPLAPWSRPSSHRTVTAPTTSEAGLAWCLVLRRPGKSKAYGPHTRHIGIEGFPPCQELSPRVMRDCGQQRKCSAVLHRVLHQLTRVWVHCAKCHATPTLGTRLR